MAVCLQVGCKVFPPGHHGLSEPTRIGNKGGGMSNERVPSSQVVRFLGRILDTGSFSLDLDVRTYDESNIDMNDAPNLARGLIQVLKVYQFSSSAAHSCPQR